MVAKKNGNRKVKNLAARSISEKKAGNVKGGIVERPAKVPTSRRGVARRKAWHRLGPTAAR